MFTITHLADYGYDPLPDFYFNALTSKQQQDIFHLLLDRAKSLMQCSVLSHRREINNDELKFDMGKI